MTRPTDAPSWFEEAGASFVAGMPAHFERLTWSAERLRDHQEQQLRRLLAAAMSGSAFHRRRLSGVDADTFTLDDLASLPVMTKSEMMSSFDEVVTDPRLRRDSVEAHVRTAGAEPVTLEGGFLPLASGGSSGERGIFVYDQAATVTYVSSFVRTGMARFAALVGWPPPMRVSIAIVGAPAAIHATSATPHLMSAFADLTFAPATLPFDEIVERVAAARPVMLAGYPSMIAELADAQAAGRLAIEPLTISPSSEQLTTELAARITEGFGVAPSSGFGTSEGLQGNAPAGSDEFTFASDCVIMEFVDERERPVPVGTTADHVLITNLYNPLQPLIRYRLDDRMTPLPAAPDHGHQRATARRPHGQRGDDRRHDGPHGRDRLGPAPASGDSRAPDRDRLRRAHDPDPVRRSRRRRARGRRRRGEPGRRRRLHPGRGRGRRCPRPRPAHRQGPPHPRRLRPAPRRLFSALGRIRTPTVR